MVREFRRLFTNKFSLPLGPRVLGTSTRALYQTMLKWVYGQCLLVARSCQTWIPAGRTRIGVNRTGCGQPNSVEIDPQRRLSRSASRRFSGVALLYQENGIFSLPLPTGCAEVLLSNSYFVAAIMPSAGPINLESFSS
jgi:hypothetical protein